MPWPDWRRLELGQLADRAPVLRGVAAEAGDLVTLLQYAHCSTRDELIDAALESWERSHAEQQIDELESIADPGERLAAVLRMATEFARAGRRRCKRG